MYFLSRSLQTCLWVCSQCLAQEVWNIVSVLGSFHQFDSEYKEFLQILCYNRTLAPSKGYISNILPVWMMLKMLSAVITWFFGRLTLWNILPTYIEADTCCVSVTIIFLERLVFERRGHVYHMLCCLAFLCRYLLFFNSESSLCQ